MKLRLRRLDAAVSRVEGALADEERLASTLVGVWRYEFGQRLDPEECMSLSRELHAGNPDAFEEWVPIRAAEVEYLRSRAKEWVAQMTPSEQRRWWPLLASDIGGIEPDTSG